MRGGVPGRGPSSLRARITAIETALTPHSSLPGSPLSRPDDLNQAGGILLRRHRSRHQQHQPTNSARPADPNALLMWYIPREEEDVARSGRRAESPLAVAMRSKTV